MRKALLPLLLLMLALVVRADSWAGPRAEGVFSKDGGRMVRIAPGENEKGARAEFYVRTPDRSYKRVADITLLNPVAPVLTLVSHDGYLLAIDNWHNAGYGEVLAVYDPNGKIVRSYRLEDMYQPKDVERVPTSVSSRWWRCNPTGFVDTEQTQVYISEFRGGNFVITLADGLLRYEVGSATCQR